LPRSPKCVHREIANAPHGAEGKGTTTADDRFGPCEPLMPIVMYPAAKHSLAGLAAVTAIFGGNTILTMLAIVMPATWGMGFLRFGRMARYTHTLAGGTILACGLAVQFLGL